MFQVDAHPSFVHNLVLEEEGDDGDDEGVSWWWVSVKFVYVLSVLCI